MNRTVLTIFVASLLFRSVEAASAGERWVSVKES